jgi:hypothetical protein
VLDLEPWFDFGYRVGSTRRRSGVAVYLLARERAVGHSSGSDCFGVILALVASYLVYYEFWGAAALSREVDHWDAIYSLALMIVLPSIGLLGWYAYNRDTVGMSAAGAIVGTWVGAVIAFYFAKDSVEKSRSSGETAASAKLASDLTKAQVKFNELLEANHKLERANEKLEFDLRQAVQVIEQIRSRESRSSGPDGPPE